MIKRLERLDVAAADPGAAAKVYARNFGFAVTTATDGRTAVVSVGGAEIRLTTCVELAAWGEGMVALWLEAEDIEAVARDLRRAGVEPGEIRSQAGRRVLEIDPRFAGQVPLRIFDRRG